MRLIRRCSRIGGGPRAARKPGSVPPVARGRWPSIWDAGLPAPLATATRGLGEQPFTAGPLPGGGSPSYLVLLRAGFTWPAGHPTAGGLLPHHFTLAGSRRRCHFCGTFLRVTPTGYYPALCSAEPGLSSPAPHGDGATTRPPRPRAILPRSGTQRIASSIARLASASAPRFRSRGTYRTLTCGND